MRREFEYDVHLRPGVASLASRLETLRSTKELAGCSTRELRSLLRHVDELTAPAGSPIAIRGEPCNQFVILASGRLYAESPRSGARILRPGDSVGWAAMWERSENEATVVAESDARLLVMGHAQFRAVKAAAGRPARVQIASNSS